MSLRPHAPLPRRLAAAAVCGGVLIALARGCTGASTAPPARSTPAEAGDPEEGADASSWTAPDAARCPSGSAPPAGVPPGWVRWDGYDPCCGIYVPSTSDSLPAPIAWQPCDSAVHLADGACRQMVVDWMGPPSGGPLSFWIAASVGADQQVTIQVSRVTDRSVLRVIGAADGPLSQAMLETTPAVCTAGKSSLGGGRYAYHLLQANAFINGGTLGGLVTDLVPTALLHFQDGTVHDSVAGQPGLVDMATMRLYPWSGGGTFQTVTTFPAGGTAFEAFFSGNAFFWVEGTVAQSRLRVWTAAAGASDLVSYGTDTSRGAVDLGGDGRDLVWLYGEGRTDPAGSFPTIAVMTSPFTADPQQLAPRRLRSEEEQYFGTATFVVGCGYAARQLPEGIRLVRLVDGASWLLPGDPTQTWQWASPFALTCTELFAKASVLTDGGPPAVTYARLRLDSLGPATPAD